MQRAGQRVTERSELPPHSHYGEEEGLDSSDEIDKGHEHYSYGRRGEKSWPAIIIMSFYRSIRYRRLPQMIRQPPIGLMKRILVLLAVLYCIKWVYNLDIASRILPEGSTMVFHEEDIHRVWEWEITSGNWMSWKPISIWVHPPRNPSLPSATGPSGTHNHGGIEGCGWARDYIHVEDLIKNATQGPPPRPLPGSIVDLDLVNYYCDPKTGQFLRDCLEYLRVSAGLDDNRPRLPLKRHTTPPPEAPVPFGSNSKKVKTLPAPKDWRYTYLEDRTSFQAPLSDWTRYGGGKALEKPLKLASPKPPVGKIAPYTIGPGSEMAERMEIVNGHRPSDFKWVAGQCNDDYPRIFHMYLDGRFDERAYMTVLSFLYTQNLGLGKNGTTSETIPCPTEFRIWVNFQYLHDANVNLKEYVSQNQWAAPFADPRFTKFIKFNFWSQRDQMDAVPEWSEDWRAIKLSDLTKRAKERVVANGGIRHGSNADQLVKAFNITMEDTAKWLLPQRYGGIYVKSGVLFLRDWEEIWNYRGAFATRTSGIDEDNAIVKLNKQSAFGTFLLRTALRSGFALDAHSVHKYVVDAGLEELLYPFPDMLADLSHWSADPKQAKRPSTPIISSPESFFEPLEQDSSATSLGISHFFRGAWFYYPQVSGDVPFDKAGRQAYFKNKMATLRANTAPYGWDLPWSAVFKRTLEAFARGEVPNMYGEMIS